MTLLLLSFALMVNEGAGQCTNTSSYLSEDAPTNNSTVTISTCTYQGDYNTINNVVAGETYVSDIDCGGYITVRSGTYNGPAVASGNAPLTWTATVNDDHFIHYNTNSGCGTATTCCETTITCTSCATCSDGVQNQGETGVDCGGPCPPCPTGPTLVPTACSNITHNMTTSSTLTFYDDGGPGGDPCADADVSTGNYCNCDCFTTVTICAAPGEYIVADFREFAMWNTTNGWDWMKIYDGANTGGALMYDNSATGPENPMGDCGIEDNVLFFCSTGQCMTFEFWATSVVNRAGWDALISSTPDQCVTLPVELVEFEGSCDNGRAELSWATASETNNDFFVLQRSKDGKEYESIDSIPGAGTTSSMTEYAVVDRDPIGEAYYRLVQYDFDGESERSEIIHIPSCGTDEELTLTVRKNGQRNASIEILTPDRIERASISLHDTRGKMIWEEERTLPSGRSQIPIGEKAARGFYFFKLQTGAEIETERVLLD